MLQFTIDFIGESLFCIFTHLLFLTLIVYFKVDVREIGVGELNEGQVSQGTRFCGS
jgi:hypothetical protein